MRSHHRLQGLRLSRPHSHRAEPRRRLPHRSRVRGVPQAEARRRRPRHPTVERRAVCCADPRPDRFRRRRIRHRPVRHGGRVLRDFQRRHGRRHHGHRQPQSSRLQRHEVRARAVAPHQRRHRTERHPTHSPRRMCIRAQRSLGAGTRSTCAASTSSTCCSYLDWPKLKKLKIVVNAGNGGAGLVIDQLEPHLPFEFVKINHTPDGTFPNGLPNPMLERPASRPSRRFASIGLTAASRGTATSTAASCSTRAARSSRATTSSACSLRCS